MDPLTSVTTLQSMVGQDCYLTTFVICTLLFIRSWVTVENGACVEGLKRSGCLNQQSRPSFVCLSPVPVMARLSVFAVLFCYITFLYRFVYVFIVLLKFFVDLFL